MASIASHIHLRPRRRHELREFHHRTKMLLTEMERQHLFAVVKEFQSQRHLDRFLRDLTHVLDTPTKLDLLKDIRYFVPTSLAIQYDRLAPYDQMAHPLKMSTKSLGRYGGKKLPSVSVQSSPMSMRHPLGMTDAPVIDPAPLKVITLVKDTDEQLGFSIRGGSEYGLGIFISDIEEDSAAEHAGLHMGDNVIEVNSVSFENIASSSAVKVLIGCNRLRILVKRIGKVPGFKSAKEKTSWFDVVQNHIVTGKLEEHGKFHSTAAIAHVNGHVNRRINLTCRREGEYLGFNIRGGREYALGIYVSGVDPDGIAEQKGLKVGDQIIAVNGHSFEEVSHMEAVEIMKSDKQLVMTVRDVGIYPVYKEIYAEYQWIDVVTGVVTKSRTTGHITSVPVTEYSPWRITDPPSDSERGQTTSIMDSDDDVDCGNFNDDENDMFNESNSMELFNARHEVSDSPTRTDIYASINSVLQPIKDDVIMQERHLETTGESKSAKPNIVVKSKSPKSTIAVRAMENETRRNHPELSSLWQDEKEIDSASNEKSTVRKKTGGKSRTIRELFFGTKSKTTKRKSATEGAQRKPRIRKALSAINFKVGSSKDTDSVKNSSGIVEDCGITHHTETELMHHMEKTAALKLSATRLLNDDEVSAVLRHIAMYKESGSMDDLVTPLAAILDTSQKATLFDEIKQILPAKDVCQFDSLVARHQSALTLDITTARGHNVSNELCRINRKCLLSPEDVTDHRDLSVVTGNPSFPHRNSKLYRAVIHDKVKGQRQDIKDSIQEESDVDRLPDPKLGYIHDSFRHRELWQEQIPEEPEDIENGMSSNFTKTSPPGVTSASQQQVSSAKSSACSSPMKAGIRLVHEIASIENGYIDDFAMAPVYETIGVPKLVSLTVTPPRDNNDSGNGNGTGETGSLDEVNAALHYLDSLDTEGSTGYQSNDDIDNSAPGSPRSIDSDVTTFGRRSAFYDLTVDDSQSCDSVLGVGDNMGCPVDDNKELLRGDSNLLGNSEGDSLNSKGCSPDSGDNRVSSTLMPSDDDEGELLRQPPPMFIPPPPPSDSPSSDSPPPEEGTGEEAQSQGKENEGQWEEVEGQGEEVKDHGNEVQGHGVDGEKQENLIPNAAVLVAQPNVIVESPANTTHHNTQSGDISDAVGDVSSCQGDTITVTGTQPNNFDDSSLDECDSDTESISTSGQFDLPGTTDLDDTDQSIVVLLDKSHRTLGISISGGSDSRNQPQVKIQKVFPGGAADIEGTIKSGMSVLTVDGHSTDDISHHEAVTIIRRSYVDKTNPVLKLVLMKD